MPFTIEEKDKLREYSREIMGGRELPEEVKTMVEQQEREATQPRGTLMKALDYVNGKTEYFDYDEVDTWNRMHPESEIGLEQIYNRAEARYQFKDLDRFERVLKRAPRSLKQNPIFHEER